MLLEKKPQTRKYKHFSLPPLPEQVRKGNLEFLYIGRNSLIINYLISNCESGYAAENSAKALNMLTRLIKHNSLPDIIIADSLLGKEELLKVHSILQDKQFSTIPYFIDNSFCSSETQEFINDKKCADDALKVTSFSPNELKKKADFWKRVKSADKEATIKENKKSLRDKTERIGKRIIDIVLSSALMILFSPVFFLVFIALKLESKGPAIYVSRRAGKGYRIFKFYKFRTMYCGADKKFETISHLNAYPLLQAPNPQFFKFSNDPRVTPIGNLLRKTSIDELPQLWNVLIGDMSLVGNRPLPLYEAETLTTDKWSKRFMAPAGITGLWQVNKNLNLSIEERLQLDIRYAEEMSLFKDLEIMAKTPTAMIQKTNA